MVCKHKPRHTYAGREAFAADGESVVPQANEAGPFLGVIVQGLQKQPLKSGQWNGGRCCPHSNNPKY